MYLVYNSFFEVYGLMRTSIILIIRLIIYVLIKNVNLWNIIYQIPVLLFTLKKTNIKTCSWVFPKCKIILVFYSIVLETFLFRKIINV